MADNELMDIFKELLEDIYHAEEQIIDALPNMIQLASDPDLKESMDEHLEATRVQKERLNDIFTMLGHTVKPGMNKILGEIISQSERMLTRVEDEEIRDILVITYGRMIENFEVSSYSMLREVAFALDEQTIADILGETMQEEQTTDEELDSEARKVLGDRYWKE